MIEIKALRPTQNATASTEESYRKTESEPVPSRWPAALAVIVLAVAGYLRSLASAETDMRAEQPKPDELASAAPEPETGEIEPESNPEDETGSLPDKTAKPDPKQDVNLGSGAAGDPVPGLADFLGIDSPPIDYEQLPLPTFVPAAFEFGLDRVSNDNGFGLALQTSGSSSPAFRSELEGFQSPSPIVVAPFKPIVVVPNSPIPDDEPGEDTETPPDPRPRNRAPRLAGAVQLGEIGPCQTLMLTLAGLLVGASDADGDTLNIHNLQVSSGTITLTESGWQYRPMAGYFGPVTVSYGVSDGVTIVAQTAALTVVEVLVLDGTSGDDVLTGTDCRDLIRGGDGNDVIDAKGGDDIVHGGAGNDLIFAGAGNDIVYGGSGNDVIHGGAGDDRLYGEDGDDRLFGEAGDDLVVGGAGNDELSGGEGNDTLQGDAGNDHIIGGAGDDVISGGDGNDIIEAGDGDDEVDGGSGDNIISTGAGHNRVSAAGGDNIVLGGSGIDLVQLGAGHDVARLGGGNDFTAGGAGNDRLFGEVGDDTLAGEAGDDLLDGGEGNDTLLGGAGDDTLLGRDGDDIIAGGDGDDEIDGGDGADVMAAGEGEDMVEAGAGDDIVLAGDGDDTVAGESGDDVLAGEAGDDCLIGGEGDDTLLGGDGNDVLKGGSGDDRLDGAQGSDTVEAAAGDDIVIAALDAEDDCLDGGSGRDTLDLSLTKAGVTVDLTQDRAVGIEIGDDTVLDFEALIGGEGDDHFIVGGKGATLTGGKGDDTFEFDEPDQPGQGLIHQILDLHEGDRIVVKQYEIHSDGERSDDQSDPFNEIYNESGEDWRPFRFRIEKVGEEERTYVDVFVTQQDNQDFSVEIYGNHKLYYY